MLLPFVAAVLALTFLPLGAAAQQPADTVRLRFGWTPGMQAEVEYERMQVRNVDGDRDSTRIASTYRLETEPDAEGLLVRYAEMRWTELPEMDGPGGEFFRALGRTESGGRPRFVVNAGGEFVSVEGVEELAGELRAAMQPLLEEMEGDGVAALRNMIETTLSDEGLAAAMAAEWTTLVGFWVDADLDTEGVWEMEDSFQTPLFPGVDIPIVTRFEVAGRVACSGEDENAPRCVELQTASIPDREAMQRAISGFIQQLGLPEEEVEEFLSQMEVETYVTLVTEPETLRPHYLQTMKVISGGQEEDEPLQVQTEIYRFRWER